MLCGVEEVRRWGEICHACLHRVQSSPDGVSDVDEVQEGMLSALDTAKHQTSVAKATFARIALACPSRREVNRGSLDDPSVWGVVALATVAEEGVNLLRTERDALRAALDKQLALAMDPEVLQGELDARIALANQHASAPSAESGPGGKPTQYRLALVDLQGLIVTRPHHALIARALREATALQRLFAEVSRSRIPGNGGQYVCCGCNTPWPEPESELPEPGHRDYFCPAATRIAAAREALRAAGLDYRPLDGSLRPGSVETCAMCGAARPLHDDVLNGANMRVCEGCSK